MTDSYTHRLRVVSCTAPFSAFLARILLAAALLGLTGCEMFDAPPEEADTIGRQTTFSSATAKPGRKSRPGFFKRFGNFMADGTECHANWWSAPELQPDIWQRLQNSYQLKVVKNDRVTVERNWYVRNQAYLNRVSARANRYLYHVAGELERRQLPGELALLPIVESAYNPYAYSRSHASGLWQFIPGTAKHLGMDMNWWYDDRRDIVAATDNALNYLVFLRDHYNGDWLKALAAYNAGWGTIDRAVAKNRAKGLPTDYWNLDVPEETQAYVPKMLALAQISKSPETYGIHWAYIPDLPYFAPITIDKQIDIPLAADTVGMNADELYLLNPGLSRWATPPGEAYRLIVPIDQANDLQEFIANNSGKSLMGSTYNRDHANPLFKEMESKVVPGKSAANANGKGKGNSRTHTVKKGDTWWSVAKQTGISSAELQKLNDMTDDEPLKLGQTLILPGKENSNTPTNSKSSKNGAKNGNKPAGKDVKETIKPSKKSSSKKPGSSVHTIKQGDTLMSIARANNVSVDNLAAWNGLNINKHSLKIGQKIKLQP